MSKQGKLYVVATPIGNLEDITLRAIRILAEVDLIAAEDTRRTKILLDRYGITTAATSLYDHNEAGKTPRIIERLTEGAAVAYVSDAGTPGISDPGYLLITESIAREIPVIPIPGPSAVVTALCVSGLPMDRFAFYGFIPPRRGRRRTFLACLSKERKSMVFYESPRRLNETLQDMEDILGDRKIVLARELTKIHEEMLRGRLSEIRGALGEKTLKGEICLILAGAGEDPPPQSDEIIDNLIGRLAADENLSTKDIVERIASESNIPKKKLYERALNVRRKPSK
ncbi:MAG: 16S rRNA (cytidine(1402)-2'-O)-methyltransferase [Deltaproteobacteria bacterium]|nr:16S rRNA (cytidine(1402)-2'-O)-methyltransferase [Deltaproteobacteria bacterium]